LSFRSLKPVIGPRDLQGVGVNDKNEPKLMLDVMLRGLFDELVTKAFGMLS